MLLLVSDVSDWSSVGWSVQKCVTTWFLVLGEGGLAWCPQPVTHIYSDAADSVTFIWPMADMAQIVWLGGGESRHSNIVIILM